jgi:ribonuclease P protein component
MVDIAQTLSPAERIRKRPDFERVYNQGLKSPGRFMTLFLLRNGSTVSRLGIAATRKLGGAVQRNRAKRLAREIFRRHKPPPGLDLVVIPRREFLNVELASLEAEYQSIVSRRAARAPAAKAGDAGSRGDRPGGNRSGGDRSGGARGRGNRPQGDRPRGDRQSAPRG